MNKITNIGNLPQHLQVMAKEFQGQRSTNFFECNNADELLLLAKNGECEETTITLDRSTSKGFMVAFSFIDSQLEDLSGDKLIVMNVYFAELNDSETKQYRALLHKHRKEQEDDMIRRDAKKENKFELKGVIE